MYVCKTSHGLSVIYIFQMAKLKYPVKPFFYQHCTRRVCSDVKNYEQQMSTLLCLNSFNLPISSLNEFDFSYTNIFNGINKYTFPPVWIRTCPGACIGKGEWAATCFLLCLLPHRSEPAWRSTADGSSGFHRLSPTGFVKAPWIKSKSLEKPVQEQDRD